MITPKLTVHLDGSTEYKVDNKYHREDGPAVEWANGYKVWFLNGKKHRVGGPAFESPEGRKEWWLNDKLHRLDGPAIESPDGNLFYIDGKKYSFEDWVRVRNLVQLL